MDKTFSFKYVDTIAYSKDNKTSYRLVLYCNFGYIVNIFTNADVISKLNELSKDKDFDINNYIAVFYDNKKNAFVYFLNVK